jgi:hypothetical protein
MEMISRWHVTARGVGGGAQLLSRTFVHYNLNQCLPNDLKSPPQEFTSYPLNVDFLEATTSGLGRSQAPGRGHPGTRDVDI